MSYWQQFLGWFSERGRAMSRYREGMESANQEDNPAAIDHYTFVINARSTPADIRAMAMYNRALVYSAMGDQERAKTDLAGLLALPSTPANIKLSAKQKLARMSTKALRTK